MKKLLFLLTDARRSTSAPVTATLAWLAKEKGMDFDAYFVGRSVPETVRDFFPKKYDVRGFIDAFLTPEDLGVGWMGGVAPFTESHLVDLYYVLSHRDSIVCTDTMEAKRFLGFLGKLGKNSISMRKDEDLRSFYHGIFSYFHMEFPEEAVMMPSTPFHLQNQLLVENYCYPDIFFSKKLGLDTSISRKELDELQKLGLIQVDLLYCPENMTLKLERHGLKTRVIDTLKPEDTYGTVTKRIFDRWQNRSKGVAYGDPMLTLYWMPFFCRNNLISMFDFDWKNFASTLATCADQTNSKVIFGRQLSDDFIPLLSKHDKIFAIIDAGRPAVTIKREIPYAPAPTNEIPWNRELSDDELLEKASQGCIPATILLYASDIRHLSIAPSLFPLASLMRVKVGVAVPVNFYEYVPEWMDDIYTPYEAGGSLPYIEPMICSVGLGAATEAEGYISKRTLTEGLRDTREWIAKNWGKASVPVGYYTFQDACPFYKHDTAEPQFEAVHAAGFKYYVTYKNEGKFPRIVYEKNDFVAVNQQNVHWTKNPLEDLKNWEKRIQGEGELGWIIVSIDSPFWGFMFYEMKFGNMLIDAINFIKKGGESGKLFSAMPHEIARYSKIIKERNLL